MIVLSQQFQKKVPWKYNNWTDFYPSKCVVTLQIQFGQETIGYHSCAVKIGVGISNCLFYSNRDLVSSYENMYQNWIPWDACCQDSILSFLDFWRFVALDNIIQIFYCHYYSTSSILLWLQVLSNYKRNKATAIIMINLILSQINSGF